MRGFSSLFCDNGPEKPCNRRLVIKPGTERNEMERNETKRNGKDRRKCVHSNVV